MSSTSPITSRARSGAARSSATAAVSTTPQRPTATRSAIGGGAAGPQAPSPHYTTSLRSRHSLYGTEDRIVLDIGSSVIKAGFSGEPAPRECRRSTSNNGGADGEVWSLEKSEATEEQWLVRELRLQRVIRSIWFENLLTDPRTRKVIVVENPLLSTRIKEMIAQILFDNLQVPSLSFAPAPVLSLMAAGRLSGLVVDVGHLETTVAPVFHSRPLFPHLAASPVAGRRLNRRLRALLLAFAPYIPPPTSLTSTAQASPTHLPREVLTEELVEEIKTRLCFVSEAAPLAEAIPSADDMAEQPLREDLDPTDEDEALVDHLYERYSRSSPSTQPVSFRVPTTSRSATTYTSSGHSVGRGWIQVPGWIRERAAEVLWEDEDDQDERGLANIVLECLLRLPIDLRKPMASSILVTGGTAMLPGFFPRFKASLLAQLERAHPPSPPPSPDLPSAEPMVISSDPPSVEDDAMSIDTTGTAVSASSRQAPTSVSTGTEDTAKRRRRHALSTRLHYIRHSPRYAPLVGLTTHLAILNHPCPAHSASSSTLARKQEGSAPSYSPALQSWVGGSLAGALKTGGEEVTREIWDAAPRRGGGSGGTAGMMTGLPTPTDEGDDESLQEAEGWERGDREGRLPDWTRLL
ncbi:hypothetical protein JCM10908_006161 [Rhodotorula pacifica]|uniref:uncharacterized protein n=1 Tax=Rhodotorula pacifica TaxID=1495444 RepID=UPI00317950C2